MEYLKDYYFNLSYHPGKANVVADALSRRTHVMASLMVKEWHLLEGLVECRPLRQSQGPVGAWVANLSVHPRLVEAIVAAQQLDSFVQETRGKLEAGEAPHFFVGVDGGLRYDLRLYVPQIEEMK